MDAHRLGARVELMILRLLGLKEWIGISMCFRLCCLRDFGLERVWTSGAEAPFLLARDSTAEAAHLSETVRALTRMSPLMPR